MTSTFGTILATAFFLLLSPKCSANPDELLQKVQAAADQNAEALGEVDLSFSASVKWAVPNLPRMVSEDGKVQILGANLRYSFERVFPVDEGRGEFRSQEEVSFDGSRYYIGSFHLTRPSIRVLSAGTSPAKDLWQQEVKSCLYLESAGFTLPKRVAEFQERPVLTSLVSDYMSKGKVLKHEVTEDNLLVITVSAPEPTVKHARTVDFESLRQSMAQWDASPAIIDSRIQSVIDAQDEERRRVAVLTLDISRDFALVGLVEKTRQGMKIREINGADFRFFKGAGIWLPQSTVIQSFVKDPTLLKGFTEEPHRTDEIKLNSLKFHVDDAISFELHPMDGP